MKLLLDTHAFIWWDSEPDKLSASALALCHDPANQLFFSVASLWEIKIKSQVGKLTLKDSLRDIVKAQQDMNGLEILVIQAEHTYFLDDLPHHHKDPFDRIIIAQAKAEQLCLITHDAMIQKYPIDSRW